MIDTNNEREQQLFDSWFWKRYGRKPDMHGNDGDCGRWSAWLGRAHLKQEPALLLQDENSGREGRRYNEWHASRPDARMNAREAAAALTPHPETPAPLRGETYAQWRDALSREDIYNFDSEGRGYKKDSGDLMRMAFEAGQRLAAPMPQSAGVTDEQISEWALRMFEMDAIDIEIELRRILALAPGVSGWQEIASAPKDSKARLVWEPRDKNIFCVTWSDGYGDEPKPGWYIFGVGGWNTSPIAAPTHWMQLPPAPGIAPHQPQPDPDATQARCGLCHGLGVEHAQGCPVQPQPEPTSKGVGND